MFYQLFVATEPKKKGGKMKLKKLIAFVLTVVSLFSFVGCNKNQVSFKNHVGNSCEALVLFEPYSSYLYNVEGNDDMQGFFEIFADIKLEKMSKYQEDGSVSQEFLNIIEESLMRGMHVSIGGKQIRILQDGRVVDFVIAQNDTFESFEKDYWYISQGKINKEEFINFVREADERYNSKFNF